MYNNMLFFIKVSVLCLIFAVIGCSAVAPKYQPDMNTVNDMKDSELPGMYTGTFTSATDEVNEISLRGSLLISPYNKSYSKYLKKALIEQLRQADIWDTKSLIVISGELLKNDVTSSMSKGESDLSARFVVHKNGNEVYSKVHAIHHEWPSAFAGAIAIPNAISNYSISVQKLLSSFLLDKDLLSALKQ